jgi:hypothetical protein
MKFLKVNTNLNTKELADYPRDDKKPIKDIEAGIEYYVVSNVKPAYDTNTSELEFVDYELTGVYDTEYTHLKICNRLYNIIPKTVPELTMEEKLVDLFDKSSKNKNKIKDLETAMLIVAKDKKDRTAEEIIVLNNVLAKMV